ncbi:response regulator [Heliobacterium gestii]|uniref:Stage 0 sporulation protein A homolog n=1 Tax=Heliomicrobium gestii TaxID=2699 RepID=A0A845L9E0_HELGE|nr:LytTR family DNA-binding domain-containing protein [Heliomicrobium gestii]MBM7867927.1 DNA-binding LytR/AlgR family response regulator [Heliomicrobium gestii]MZP43262.1 response regulator [Heliomicrobium gestii]
MNLLIVDDEPQICELLTSFITMVPDAVVVGTAGNIEDFALAVATHRPDAVFLDISLQGGDGIEAAKQIMTDFSFEVVIVSGHDLHALRAFDIRPLDFIVKPFLKKDVMRSLIRLRERLAEKQKAPEHRPGRILFRETGGFRFVSCEDIIMIEAIKNGCLVHVSKEPAPFRFNDELWEITRQLERFPNLCRIHKGFVVNINYIDKLDRQGKSNLVTFRHTKAVATVGEKYYRAFLEKFRD